MKKVFIFYLIGFFSFSGLCLGQDQMDKIESARIGLITERLGLDPDQAERFWPIYNEFIERRRSLRNEFNQARKNIDIAQATEAQRQQLIEKELDMKQREVGLEKDYSDRLLNIISTRQLLALRKAEQDFREMLLRRLQQRRLQQQRKERLQDRFENRLQDRRNN
ncbi:MAG: hypothetical protein ACNS62_11885 [Candidatus Cyclobacteriaceae bacterium M3_2C_046]